MIGYQIDDHFAFRCISPMDQQAIMPYLDAWSDLILSADAAVANKKYHFVKCVMDG